MPSGLAGRPHLFHQELALLQQQRQCRLGKPLPQLPEVLYDMYLEEARTGRRTPPLPPPPLPPPPPPPPKTKYFPEAMLDGDDTSIAISQPQEATPGVQLPASDGAAHTLSQSQQAAHQLDPAQQALDQQTPYQLVQPYPQDMHSDPSALTPHSPWQGQFEDHRHARSEGLDGLLPPSLVRTAFDEVVDQMVEATKYSTELVRQEIREREANKKRVVPRLERLMAQAGLELGQSAQTVL